MKSILFNIVLLFSFIPLIKGQEVETDLNKLFGYVVADSSTHYEINYSIVPERSKFNAMPATAVSDFIKSAGITIKHTELIDQATYFTKSEKFTIWEATATDSKNIIEFTQGELSYKCQFDKHTKLDFCSTLKMDKESIGKNEFWGLLAFEYAFFNKEKRETAQFITNAPLSNSIFNLFFCNLVPQSFPTAFTITINHNQLYFKLNKVKLNQSADFIQPVNYNDIKAVETPINQLLVHFIENK